MYQDKVCIIIVGPTASGKTALSMALAAHYNTAIISADSRQCYQELNIGVAKPSTAELNQVKHYFVNTHSVQQEVNAGIYETYALQAVEHIFSERDVAIMAGGTGLYIKAFCEGMDMMPGIDEKIRVSIRKQYEEYGMDWLQQMIQQHDALYFSKGEVLNPQRMMRALEVKLSIGKSILELQMNTPRQRPFRIKKIGIQLDRQQVYNNINRRVDIMMDMGLLDEVKALEKYRHLNALQTVGYSEIFEYLDGALSLEQSIEQIKRNTRHYAKRQLTWFNRDEDIMWYHPSDISGIIAAINNK